MAQEFRKIRTPSELMGGRLEDLLHGVARGRESIIFILKTGESVMITPASQLKPLPRLDGRVPEGWKDAVY